MTVNSYLYQSHYPQPFQVGRPDPEITKERAEETQNKQERLQADSQRFSEEKSSFERSEMAVKSAIGYANSEGFGISAEQVRRLSDASFRANRNDYLKVYSES